MTSDLDAAQIELRLVAFENTEANDEDTAECIGIARLLLAEVKRVRAELAAEREARATTLAGFHAEHVALAAERERAERLEKAGDVMAVYNEQTLPWAATKAWERAKYRAAPLVHEAKCAASPNGLTGEPDAPCDCRPSSEESWFRGEVDERLITKVAAEQPDLPLGHPWQQFDPGHPQCRKCGQPESAHRREPLSTSAPVPENHPLMLAWKAYTQTEEYANTFRWASRPEHTEGSLWAAFEQGWRARGEQS